MGPTAYTLLPERDGNQTPVKRVLRPEQLPPGGKLLYREGFCVKIVKGVLSVAMPLFFTSLGGKVK